MSESKTKSVSSISLTVSTQCSTNLTDTEYPTLQMTSRILRSPSHESVTTDLSLFSVSSVTSDLRGGSRLVTFKSYTDVHNAGRGPSPKSDSRQTQSNRPADIPEILWFEEENELIRSCGLLSSVLGLRKSFSTSDVSQLPSPDALAPTGLRSAVSSLALNVTEKNNLVLENAQLNHASRSCSTWVAVGEPVANTSQLPSPHGGVIQEHQQQQPCVSYSASSASTAAPFTGADFVRSMNKKIRQNYIRRRLITTYRALERLSQSEFNLDQLEVVASTAQTTSRTLLVPTLTSATGVPLLKRKEHKHALTVKDVERERGNQLSKYERNMMIFNWLHTLDDHATDDSVE